VVFVFTENWEGLLLCLKAFLSHSVSLFTELGRLKWLQLQRKTEAKKMARRIGNQWFCS
jgi:hypothetical protein